MQQARANSSRKDRPSIDVVPELSMHTTTQWPLVQNLFEDTTDSSYPSGSHADEITAKLEQENIEDTVYDEVAAWLTLIERDDYWPMQRRQLQGASASLRTNWRVSATLQRTISPSVTASEVPESVLHFIALQLLASCYTFQPASSATNLPILGQRRKTELITALWLHLQYRFAPAAGYHARPPSETPPWPGLSTGFSIEEELAELISKRRLRERDTVNIPVSPVRNISRRQLKTTGWNDGPAPSPDRERNSYDALDDSKTASTQGRLSKFMCLPAHKGTKQPPVTIRLHKEPQGPRPQFQPRLSSFSNADSQKDPLWHRPSRSLRKSSSALKLRRAQSSPERKSTSPAPSREVLDTRRNSSTPTLAGPKTFPYPIPEIRRISASTQGYNQSPPPFALPTDLVTAQEYFDETRLSPFFASIPSRLLRAANIPLDSISPFTCTDTLPTELNRQASGYFEHVYIQEGELVAEGPNTLDNDGNEGIGERGRTDVEYDSDDSIDALDARGKRENVLSRKRSVSPEMMEQLRRSGSPSSEGSGDTRS